MKNDTGKNTNRCEDIRRLLVDYAMDPDEISAGDKQKLEEHARTCRGCAEEYGLIGRLNMEAGMVDAERNRVMATIDWEENAYEVSAAAVRRRAPRFRFSLNLSDYGFGFNWKLAVPALASVLLMGIGLGYLLFHGDVSPSSPSLLHQGQEYAVEIPSNGGRNSLDRLENTLAKKEVSGYFQQTQLTLTDLMKQCDTDGAFSFRDNVDMQRVRSLLAKGRYFDQNLNDPQLISGKQLVKKIDWLLFEILMMDTDDKTSCEKLRQLQEYIKKERLLLKIRLVSKDFSTSEV